MQIASLIAGLSAVALYLLCFQLKSAKQIIACKLVSSILYVVQYLLLFAFVGAAMDAAAFITSYFAYKKDTPIVKKFKIPIIVISNILILIVGLSLYVNIFSLLPIAGVMFESAASWMKREKMIRIVSIFAVPCWFVYNLVSGAYGSAVGSILAFASIVTSLARYSAGEEQSVSKSQLRTDGNSSDVTVVPGSLIKATAEASQMEESPSE